ncbi:hypothetical protein KC867_02795 [Candidatus Saccharibacteria bacterium]|nr:hypothetical protein [Candidatus Saccharibacteria bacterium]
MLQNIPIYRLRIGALLRQFYIPGMRGAALVFMVNVLIIIIIKIVTIRMMREASLQHKKFIAPSAHRRLAHAHN